MTTPPGAPGKPGAGSWVKRNKWLLVGAAAVAGVAGLAIIKGKGSGSSASSGTGSVPSGAVTYADNSGDYNSLESQIANLQNQIGSIQQTPGPAGPPGKNAPPPRRRRKTVPPGRRPPRPRPPHKISGRRK